MYNNIYKKIFQMFYLVPFGHRTAPKILTVYTKVSKLNKHTYIFARTDFDVFALYCLLRPCHGMGL